MRRRDAIKPNFHRDYSSLCASHVPITTYLFGDNLQAQLNDIRASNKISKSTMPQRYDKARTYGTWGNNNTSNSDGKPRRGPFLLHSGQWKQQPPPPRSKFQLTQEACSNKTPTEPITDDKDIYENPLENLQVSSLEEDLPSVTEYLNKQVHNFQAGQLNHKLCELRKITFDSEVLQTVCGEVIEFNS